MSWTTPPTLKVGEVPTAALLNQISDDLTFLHAAPSCCFTRTAAGQTVSNANEANLVFPDIVYDTDSMHASNTDIRFTTAGLYLIGSSRLAWANSAVGARQARIRATGTVFAHRLALTAASAACTMSVTGIVRAAAAGGAVIGVYQKSGGNLDLSSLHRTYAHWIGG